MIELDESLATRFVTFSQRWNEQVQARMKRSIEEYDDIHEYTALVNQASAINEVIQDFHKMFNRDELMEGQ